MKLKMLLLMQMKTSKLARIFNAIFAEKIMVIHSGNCAAFC